MEAEFYTFPDTVEGLEHALHTTLTLRSFGFHTRLATREISRFVVHTVIATPAPRPNRAKRGCNLNAR
jgi:hypothetical protein